MKRKERLRVRGIIATTDPVEKGGRTYRLTEETLKKAADTIVGKPILYKHRGKPIGKIVKAWYGNGKLYGEGVIYEPENEAEQKIVERIEKRELTGISPGFVFEAHKPPPRVILHGSLEVIGETEDGTLIVRASIPKEEVVQKLGSLENVKSYVFDRCWMHDGSLESKKKIELEYLEGNESS